jgi:hypothetical protein
MTRLDHAVIFVDDVAEAMHQYAANGFTVSTGGTHAGGLTHNALISFADGTYVELLGFTWSSAFQDLHKALTTGVMAARLEGSTALDRRFLPRGSTGPGLADFAVSCDNLDAVITAARGEGLVIDGPFPGSRHKPDGTEVSWNLAMPRDNILPFLIEDVTDRRRRVQPVDVSHHANGVTGIVEVRYRVNETGLESFTKLANALGVSVRSDTHSAILDLPVGQVSLSVGVVAEERPYEVSFALTEGGRLSHPQ